MMHTANVLDTVSVIYNELKLIMWSQFEELSISEEQCNGTLLISSQAVIRHFSDSVSTQSALRHADSNIRLQLEKLSITGEQSDGNWHVGMDCIPEEWASLTRLTKLELRGHSLLNVSRIPEP